MNITQTFFRKATLVALFSVTTILMGGMFAGQAFAGDNTTKTSTSNSTVVKVTNLPVYVRGMTTINWTDSTSQATNVNPFQLQFIVSGTTANTNTITASTAATFDSSSNLYKGSYESWNTAATKADGTPITQDGSYYIGVTDSTGITGNSGTSANFNIDNTAPTTALSVSPSLPNGTSWYNKSTHAPVITLTCTDSIVNSVSSGCSEINYAWYNATTGDILSSFATTTAIASTVAGSTGTASTVSTPVLKVPQGDNILKWSSEDNAVDTNLAHNISTTYTKEFKVDTVAPAAPIITQIGAPKNYINSANEKTVSVIGTAEKGSTVSVTLGDGTKTTTAVTDTANSSTGAYHIVVDASVLAEGQITATVNATDVAGNTSTNTIGSTTKATKDTVAQISSITSNATTAGILKIGDKIVFTMTPTTNEVGATVTGSYNGQSLTWSSNNNNDNGMTVYTATYTVTEGNPDQTTPLQITGVTYTDVAGNTSSVFSGTDVKKDIDATRPTLKSVSISSNNATDPVYVKTGATVILSFTSSEVIGIPTVKIEGHAVITPTNISGTNKWEATYIMQSADTQGPVTFTINYVDNAGNTGAKVVHTTDNSSVTFDRTPPTVVSHTFDGSSSNVFFNPKNNKTTLVVKAGESVNWISLMFQTVGGSSVKTYQPGSLYDGTKSVTQIWDGKNSSTYVPDGTYKVKVHIQDLAGNNTISVLGTPTITVDTTNPTITYFTSPAKDIVYRAAPALVFTPNDTNLKKCSYTVDNGSSVSVSCTSGTAVSGVKIPGLNDGRHTVDITVTDKAGNTSSKSVSFVYDNNHVLTVGPNGQDFKTIKGAIDAWVSGITTIQVASGTYTGDVTVGKSLSILGPNATIDPNGSTQRKPEATINGLVTVKAGDVNVSGFTITNPSGSVGITVPSGQHVDNFSYNIFNDISGAGAKGIYLAGGQNGVTIAHNLFSNITSNTSAKWSAVYGIFVGEHSTSAVASSTGITINDNVFNNIKITVSNQSANAKYAIAYGVYTDNSNGAGLTITGNTFSNLEGFGTHAIGLEGPTPSASIMGNTFRALSTTATGLAGYDKFGIFFQYNPDGGSVTITGNKFDGLNPDFGGIAVSPKDDGSAVSYTVQAQNNWWGNKTGPYSPAISGSTYLNPNGLGVYVSSHVDFNPFYNSKDMTNIVSSAPIASFALNFGTNPQQVGQNSTLTVTGKDAGGITVVNDKTTKMNIAGDNGSSFGKTLLTMGALGNANTTITNTNAGIVNVTATEVGGTATGAGTITFTATPTMKPKLTLMGTLASPYTVSTATSRFSSGLQFTTANATSFTVNGGMSKSITLGAQITAVSKADAITLGLHLYTVIVTSSTGNTATKTTAYQVNANPAGDTIPPVITLLGQNPLTLTVGDTYKDPGATASDNVDGNLTSKISVGTVSGNAVQTSTAGTYVVTYNVSDATGNKAVQVTRTVIVVNKAVTPVPSIITLVGKAIASPYTVSTATSRFPNGLQFDTTGASSVTVNGTSVTPVSGVVTAATPMQAITLGLHVYNVVVTSSTGNTANITIAYNVKADFNDTAALAVTGIGATQDKAGLAVGYAVANGGFDKGWKWTFHVTVPTNEKYLRMKFGDFVGVGGSTIPVGSNLRFYSAQAVSATASTTAITIGGANAYSAQMQLSAADLSPTTPGRQIDITVEMQVPTGTAGGSYSTSYGIDTTATAK